MWVAFEIDWAVVIPSIRSAPRKKLEKSVPQDILIKVTTQASSFINVRYVAIGCFLRHPKALFYYFKCDLSVRSDLNWFKAKMS